MGMGLLVARLRIYWNILCDIGRDIIMLISKDGEQINENIFAQYDIIIFYGASTRNKKVIDKYGIRDKVRYVVDSNTDLEGESIDGYKIYRKEKLQSEKKALILTVLERCAEDIIESTRPYVTCDLCFYISGEGDLQAVRKENENVMKCIKGKKYIHLFPDEKFLLPFYTMLEEHFCIEEHLFIIDYSRVDWPEDQYKNLDYAYKKNQKNHNIMLMKDFGGLRDRISKKNTCNDIFMSAQMRNLFSEVQKIILHSVAFSDFFLKYIQSMIKMGCGDKMIWICWGGDIYFEKNSFVATQILENISYGSAAANRIEVILKKCNIQMKETNVVRYAYIPSQFRRERGKMDSGLEMPLNVLLGHYAAEDNRLEYGLDLLYKFRDKNMNIYCTLSYGSDSYKEKVVKKGKEMFGEKFIPITYYIELNQYWEFLGTIDVAIYPMIRFAAGTTLSYLHLLGKRIYMRKEMIAIGITKGIYIEDIEEINKQGWEEFAGCDVKVHDSLEEQNNKIVSYWKTTLYDEQKEVKAT